MIKARNISDVVSDMKQGKLNPDKFLISYTVDPKTGIPITLNNRGLAALSEANMKPELAVKIPYNKVPSYLLEDTPSKEISITKNKDGSGVIRTVSCPF